jgi:hypothetical protein
MDGIRMRLLLGADREVERLEREGGTAVELAQKVNDRLVGGDGAHILVKAPSVLDAPLRAGLVAAGRIEINAIAGAASGKSKTE